MTTPTTTVRTRPDTSRLHHVAAADAAALADFACVIGVGFDEPPEAESREEDGDDRASLARSTDAFNAAIRSTAPVGFGTSTSGATTSLPLILASITDWSASR